MNVDGKDFLGPEGPWVKGSGIAIHQVNNSPLWIRDSHVDLCHMLEIVEENCPVSTPWKADQAPAKLKRRASVSALCGPQPIASPRRYKTDTCWGEKNPPAGKQQWNPAHQRGEKHQGILETKPHKINLKKSLRDNSLRDFWIHSKKFGPVGYIRLMQTAFPLKAATPDSFMVRASEKRESVLGLWGLIWQWNQDSSGNEVHTEAEDRGALQSGRGRPTPARTVKAANGCPVLPHKADGVGVPAHSHRHIWLALWSPLS